MINVIEVANWALAVVFPLIAAYFGVNWFIAQRESKTVKREFIDQLHQKLINAYNTRDQHADKSDEYWEDVRKFSERLEKMP